MLAGEKGKTPSRKIRIPAKSAKNALDTTAIGLTLPPLRLSLNDGFKKTSRRSPLQKPPDGPLFGDNP
jgi:hypothetical protein